MRNFSCLILFICFYSQAYAQEKVNSDELFGQARSAAFEDKNYPLAIEKSKQALELSPNYTDIRVFLGRLYTWSEDLTSARELFSQMRKEDLNDADFYLAYSSLEYWNDNSLFALELLEEGLIKNPAHSDLILLQAKILYSEDRYEEASKVLEEELARNSQNALARELLEKVSNYNTKNALGLSYSYSHFDKQFEEDWHTVSLSYKRATPIGSVIFKLNHANKFGNNGLQAEVEAYPRINDLFYLYLGVGYSGDVGIFPKFRTGASLYANLPKSFEAEVGYRHLQFDSTVWMFTGSVGKYYKNYWFNLRTYLTPSTERISQSYTGTVRYYLKSTHDYIGFQIGTGISPDDTRTILLGDSVYRLKTFKLGLDYNFTLSEKDRFSVSTMYFNQEYRPGVKGNQVDVSLGYSRLF
ncbi:YaiO family outer membrane beta-barrel protein [Chryseobacterium sp. A301]